jgi:hypothetical protein
MNHCLQLIQDIRELSRSEQVAESFKFRGKKVTIIEYGYGGFPNNGIILEKVISESLLQRMQKIQLNDIIWYRQVLSMARYKLCQADELNVYEKILLP